MGCHFLLQGIFPTQGSNPCLLHCRWVISHRAASEALYAVEWDKESPRVLSGCSVHVWRVPDLLLQSPICNSTFVFCVCFIRCKYFYLRGISKTILFCIYDQPRYHIEKQRHYFANKGLSSQCNGFSSGHEWMWELDCEGSRALKNWCFWTVVLEKTLESPLDCKEIQLVHPKGDQLSVHWKDWIWSWNSNTLATSCKELTHWKRPWCWRDWKQEEKGMTEDEMIG